MYLRAYTWLAYGFGICVSWIKSVFSPVRCSCCSTLTSKHQIYRLVLPQQHEHCIVATQNYIPKSDCQWAILEKLCWHCVCVCVCWTRILCQPILYRSEFTDTITTVSRDFVMMWQQWNLAVVAERRTPIFQQSSTKQQNIVAIH